MFQTINQKVANGDFELDIQNLEVSYEHLKGVKYLKALATDLDVTLYGAKEYADIDRSLIKFFILLQKDNPRIQDIKFFQENATLIALCISDVRTFKPENMLLRTAKIDFLKQKRMVIFNDLTQEEWEKGITLPETWKPFDTLNEKYTRHKTLFLNT